MSVCSSSTSPLALAKPFQGSSVENCGRLSGALGGLGCSQTAPSDMMCSELSTRQPGTYGVMAGQVGPVFCPMVPRYPDPGLLRSLFFVAPTGTQMLRCEGPTTEATPSMP